MKFCLILSLLVTPVFAEVPQHGASIHSIVIHGQSVSGATFTTGSGTPLNVTFSNGTAVPQSAVLPRIPASPVVTPTAAPANPIPYNSIDYWERPLEKKNFYFK
jgi:hypothetical protein